MPDALRGRVVSIYMVALRGGGPLGGLVAGALADHFSASRVMAVNGTLLALIAGSLLIFRRGDYDVDGSDAGPSISRTLATRASSN